MGLLISDGKKILIGAGAGITGTMNESKNRVAFKNRKIDIVVARKLSNFLITVE